MRTEKLQRSKYYFIAAVVIFCTLSGSLKTCAHAFLKMWTCDGYCLNCASLKTWTTTSNHDGGNHLRF